jgi:collagen type III alpha
MATDLGKAHEAAAKHDAYVKGQLGRAEARIRFLDLTAAFLGLVGGTMIFALVMALCDRAFELSEPTRRLAFFSYLIGAGIYLYFTAGRPLSRRVNPYFAARQVEQTLPGAKNSVVNWLDLRGQNLPAVIRGAVGKRAARDLAQADLDKAISGRRAGWVGGITAFLAVVFLFALVKLGPAQFFSLMGRTFKPFESIGIASGTQLTVVQPQGGNALVAIGRSVTIAVEVEGQTPDPTGPEAVKVLFRYQESEPYQERLLQQETGRGDWSTTLSPTEVQNGFWYKVTGGDAATPEYRVTVRATPLLTDFDAIYHFRPYVARRTEIHHDRRLEAMRGTEVEIVGHANRAIKDAHLDFVPKEGNGGENKTLRAERVEGDPQAFRVRLVLEQDGHYRLRYVSTDGEAFVDSIAHPIVARPDYPPTVELTVPGKDVELPVNGLLKLAGWAADDVGVKSLGLQMQVVGGSSLPVRPYRSEADLRFADGGFPLRIEYKDAVDLAKLQNPDDPTFKLVPDMVLEYWLEASDACDFPKPNVAVSKHYRVKLIAAEKNEQKQQQEREQAQKEQKQHEQKQDEQKKQEEQQRQQERDRQEAEENQHEQERKQNQQGKADQQNVGKDKNGEKNPDQANNKEGSNGDGNPDQKNKEQNSDKPNSGQDKQPGDKNNEGKPDKNQKGDGSQNGANESGNNDNKPDGQKNQPDKNNQAGNPKENPSKEGGNENKNGNNDKGGSENKGGKENKGANENTGANDKNGGDKGGTSKEKQQEMERKRQALNEALDRKENQKANEQKGEGKGEGKQEASQGKEGPKPDKQPNSTENKGKENAAKSEARNDGPRDPKNGASENKDAGQDKTGEPKQGRGDSKDGKQADAKQDKGTDKANADPRAAKDAGQDKGEGGKEGPPQPAEQKANGPEKTGQDKAGQDKPEQSNAANGNQTAKADGKEGAGDKPMPGKQPPAEPKGQPTPQTKADGKPEGKDNAPGKQDKAAPKDEGKKEPGSTQARQGDNKDAQPKGDNKDVAKADGKDEKGGQGDKGGEKSLPSPRDVKIEDVQRVSRDANSDKKDEWSRDEMAKWLEQVRKENPDADTRKKAEDVLNDLKKEGVDAKEPKASAAKDSPKKEPGSDGKEEKQAEAKAGKGEQEKNAGTEKQADPNGTGQPKGDGKDQGKGDKKEGDGPDGKGQPGEGDKGEGQKEGDAKGKGKPGQGDTPGGGDPNGKRAPQDLGPNNDQTPPPNPEAAAAAEKKASMLQLRRFHEAVDDKVLQDAGLTREQFQELQDYLEKKVQAPETLPPSTGSSTLPTVGVRTPRPAGTDTAGDLNNGGRSVLPPGYGDVIRQFQKEVNTPGTGDKK